MLEFDSLNALRHEPSTNNHAIRLEADLGDAEISGSAVTANALILLRRAAQAGGLKLTATGNLSRAVVEGRGREGLESAHLRPSRRRARTPEERRKRSFGGQWQNLSGSDRKAVVQLLPQGGA